MCTRSPIDGPYRVALPAALLLCAVIALLARADAEDEHFARRLDTGFAKALIHAGVCTIALRASTFTYATPYDCTAIVATYLGQPLDDLPPEAVVARSLIARIQRDPQALVACYDEASQAKESRAFTDYLESGRAQAVDPAHVTAALIAGAFIADALHIQYRIQDGAGTTMFAWYAVLKRSGRGWRLTAWESGSFPNVFCASCAAAMQAHGALSSDELEHMSLCRILTTPTVHPQLVQPQDLRQGDLAMAVLVTMQEPPLLLDGAAAVMGDAGLLALCRASRLYASAGGEAEAGSLWLNGDPAVIPASPFAAAGGKPRLQFCHGSIPGDDCSIYLLGDGQAALSDIMLGARNGAWKLMNEALLNAARSAAIDGGLWDLNLNSHLWAQLSELLRKRGE